MKTADEYAQAADSALEEAFNADYGDVSRLASGMAAQAYATLALAAATRERPEPAEEPETRPCRGWNMPAAINEAGARPFYVTCERYWPHPGEHHASRDYSGRLWEWANDGQETP